MKTILCCFSSTSGGRERVNMHDSSNAGERSFFLLPGRQTSFVKIIELPPVSRKKLKGMVQLQINKIYPGNTGEVSFDFIPFKTPQGWKTVIYIIKNSYLKELFSNRDFTGIILPLQLVSKKELLNISSLVFSYPDMMEIWNLNKGIPEEVVRCEKKYNRMVLSGKSMAIVPVNEVHRWKAETKIETIKTYPANTGTVRKGILYFETFRRRKPDRITPAAALAAFVLSLALLTVSIAAERKMDIEKRAVHAYSKSIHILAAENKKKLDTIKNLDAELLRIKENVPVNVYETLLRVQKAVVQPALLLSFSLNNKTLTLTLHSNSALGTLEGLKRAFGAVKVSGIRALDDGTEKYTVRVELEK